MKKRIYIIPISIFIFIIAVYLLITYYPIFNLQRKLSKTRSTYLINDKLAQNISYYSIDSLPKKYAGFIVEFEKKKRFPFSRLTRNQIKKIGYDCLILPNAFLTALQNKDEDIWPLGKEEEEFSPEYIRSKINEYDGFVRSLYNNFEDIGGLGAYFNLTDKKEFIGDLRDLRIGINGVKNRFLDIANGYSTAIRCCNNARSKVQRGLRIIDGVNTKFSQYERIETLEWAYDKYEEAVDYTTSARDDLRSALSISYGNSRRTAIVHGIIRNEYDNIQQIHSKVWHKRGEIHSAYYNARKRESTTFGKISRSVGRWWESTSQSKIGKELSSVTKTLILGTQVFYELLSMEPNDDIFSITGRHNREIEQILNEVEKIERMEGLSLLDLSPENAIYEAFVASWYNNLFGPQKQQVHQKEEGEYIKIDTDKLSPELEVSHSFRKNDLTDRWGITTPCYIVCVSACKTESEAIKRRNSLSREGYSTGYLWIPDYESLSGSEYFEIFIGPFESKEKCKRALYEYRLIDNSAYGILVAHKLGRVEVR